MSLGAGPDESRKTPPTPPGLEPRAVQPVTSRYTENFTILNTNIIHALSVEIYVKLSLQKNPNPKASDGVNPTSQVRLSSKTK